MTVAAKVELTPEEARNWRLAKLFDLRSFIGSLFVIFGILVTAAGIAASKATITKAPTSTSGCGWASSCWAWACCSWSGCC